MFINKYSTHTHTHIQTHTYTDQHTHTHTHTGPIELIKLFICQPPSCRLSNSHNNHTRPERCSFGRQSVVSVATRLFPSRLVVSDSIRLFPIRRPTTKSANAGCTKRRLVTESSRHVSRSRGGGVGGGIMDYLTSKSDSDLLDRFLHFYRRN